MVIVNRQSSFYIRKCLLLLTVFQVIYISSILFRVHCRVNSGGKVKRYDIENYHAIQYRKVILSRALRHALFTSVSTENRKLSTIQRVLLYFYTV